MKGARIFPPSILNFAFRSISTAQSAMVAAI
jgi:hypothetical protein